MIFRTNPFPSDPDRAAIWHMLVDRDIEAFCQADWNMVAQDFVEEHFMGIDGASNDNPDNWRLTFPDLSTYRDEWVKQAIAFQGVDWAEDPVAALFRITTLRDIDIQGDSALVHKKFAGKIKRSSGAADELNWQTLYRCRKVAGAWKIVGFTGYLPYPMGSMPAARPAISKPANSSQHITAGPYSPVLHVHPGQIIVISGQAAINRQGKVIGTNIEEQTHATMENCRQQLMAGGCTLDDVFKVNVYLTDLDLWPRFNEVYRTYFNEPLPARTAVGTTLLYDFLVEIEMWACKG